MFNKYSFQSKKRSVKTLQCIGGLLNLIHSGHWPLGFRTRAHSTKDRSRFGQTGCNHPSYLSSKTVSLAQSVNALVQPTTLLKWDEQNICVGGCCSKQLLILGGNCKNQHMALMALIGQSTFLHKTVSLWIWTFSRSKNIEAATFNNILYVVVVETLRLHIFFIALDFPCHLLKLMVNTGEKTLNGFDKTIEWILMSIMCCENINHSDHKVTVAPLHTICIWMHRTLEHCQCH